MPTVKIISLRSHVVILNDERGEVGYKKESRMLFLKYLTLPKVKSVRGFNRVEIRFDSGRLAGAGEACFNSKYSYP